MKKVAIIMGSDSDLPVVSKAADTLKQFGVPYELHIYSAHRTPVEAKEFSENARENGFGCIIAAAGMAAHLAGAIAANTTLPVIGIPMKSKYLDGIDALLSTVQMPSGIPVATVAIDGAVNAALLSIEILAVTDEELAKKLKEVSVKFVVGSGADGRLYGSVTAKDIAEELEKQHKLTVDKRKLNLADTIKTYGSFTVGVKLYTDVNGEINVIVSDK